MNQKEKVILEVYERDFWREKNWHIIKKGTNNEITRIEDNKTDADEWYYREETNRVVGRNKYFLHQ